MSYRRARPPGPRASRILTPSSRSGAIWLLLIVLLVSSPNHVRSLEQSGVEAAQWWEGVGAAFGASMLQSYLLVDGIKVLALALTSPVAIPPSTVHPLLLKLLRSVHRGIDFLL